MASYVPHAELPRGKLKERKKNRERFQNFNRNKKAKQAADSTPMNHLTFGVNTRSKTEKECLSVQLPFSEAFGVQKRYRRALRNAKRKSSPEKIRVLNSRRNKGYRKDWNAHLNSQQKVTVAWLIYLRLPCIVNQQIHPTR